MEEQRGIGGFSAGLNVLPQRTGYGLVDGSGNRHGAYEALVGYSRVYDSRVLDYLTVQGILDDRQDA